MSIDDPMSRALTLLAGAPSWHELKRSLDETGLSIRIDPAGLDALLAAWHRKEVAALSDEELVAEISFWAEGGGYAEHMRGYFAVPPRILVEEAGNRTWFVAPLGSGGAIVNAPGGRPLVVRSLPPPDLSTGPRSS